MRVYSLNKLKPTLFNGFAIERQAIDCEQQFVTWNSCCYKGKLNFPTLKKDANKNTYKQVNRKQNTPVKQASKKTTIV